MSDHDRYHLALSPLTYWCRVWQVQMEFGLQLWGMWAANVPHPDSRALATEAEALHTARPADAPEKPKRARQPGSRALR